MSRILVCLNDLRRIAGQYQGECLTRSLTGTTNPCVKMRCKSHHSWKAKAQSILAGNWCPRCKRDAEKLRQLQKLAASRGGELISKEFLGAAKHHTWQCEKGHIWKARPAIIKSQNQWCPKCGYGCPEISDMRRFAAKNGGQCLSTEYINSRTKLQWRCKDGHVFSAVYSSIQQGTWCQKCRGGKRQITIDEMKQIAKKRGGYCLSTHYVNGVTPLRWQCAQGHTWETKPRNIFLGYWCRQCAGKARDTIEHMRELAEEHWGRCLSTVYVNGKTKLKWQCSEGHVWETTPTAVKSGQWCGICAIVARRKSAA